MPSVPHRRSFPARVDRAPIYSRTLSSPTRPRPGEHERAAAARGPIDRLLGGALRAKTIQEIEELALVLEVDDVTMNGVLAVLEGLAQTVDVLAAATADGNAAGAANA